MDSTDESDLDSDADRRALAAELGNFAFPHLPAVGCFSQNQLVHAIHVVARLRSAGLGAQAQLVKEAELARGVDSWMARQDLLHQGGAVFRPKPFKDFCELLCEISSTSFGEQPDDHRVNLAF